MAAEGVQTVIAARWMDALNELASEIEGSGDPKPVAIAGDLYEENASTQLAQAAIDTVGHIDILINNAGGSRPFSDLHVDEEA